MKRFTIIAAAAGILAFSCATTKTDTTAVQSAQDKQPTVREQLVEYVKQNDTSALRQLVDETAPSEIRAAINEKLPNGRTLLHSVVLSEYEEITRILISAGADKSARDSNGKSAADYAKTARSRKIREMFGFRESAAKITNETPATQTGTKTVREEPGFADFSGSYEVVFGATDSAFLKAVKEQNYAESKRLLEKGQNVNVVDMKGNSALFYALANKNDAIVGLLLKYDINCNYPNNAGQYPFLYAVDKGGAALITTLINAGANIDSTDGNEVNAVMIAVRKKNISLLKFLHSKGAELWGKDPQGNSLLQMAIKNEDIGCVRYLLENDGDVYATNNNGTTALEMLKNARRQDLRSLADKYE